MEKLHGVLHRKPFEYPKTSIESKILDSADLKLKKLPQKNDVFPENFKMDPIKHAIHMIKQSCFQHLPGYQWNYPLKTLEILT